MVRARGWDVLSRFAPSASPCGVAEPTSPCAHSLRSFRLPPELRGVAGRIPLQAGRLKPLGNLSILLLFLDPNLTHCVTVFVP